MAVATAAPTPTDGAADAEPGAGRAGRARRNRPRPAAGLLGRRALATGLVVLSALLLVAPLLLRHGDRDIVGAPFSGPSGDAWFGTDDQGRDLFTRVLLGMRTSWLAAFAVIAVGAVIGSLVGLAAGSAGGLVDTLLMRITDAALALPGPIIALCVVAALGSGLRNTLIAVAATWWPWYARIVRGQVVAIAARPHVEAARLGGISRRRVALLHILPGVAGSIAVTASLDIGAVMLVLSGLSFLGLGAPPPAPELGAMTARGLTYLFNAAHVALVPALALFALAAFANFAGDAVRDLLER